MPDDIIVSINTPPKSVGSTSTPSGNRDEWLAQLEDAAFALRDDSLRPHQDDARNPANGDHPQMPTDEPVSSTSAQEQSITDIQNVFSTRVSQQYLSRNAAAIRQFISRPSSPLPPSVGTTSTLTSNGPSSPGVRPATSAPRLEQLLNRLHFSELNISVTSRGDEMTIWVRDFKQKYGAELFHWVQDLQQLLESSGKTLARVMVNGKQVQHLNELLGGGKWQ